MGGMRTYWQRRREQAIENSSKAASPVIRQTHLRAAEYYRSLEKCCSRAHQTGATKNAE